MHHAETGSYHCQKTSDGTRVDVECPPLLPDYQAFMHGVDRSNQLIGL